MSAPTLKIEIENFPNHIEAILIGELVLATVEYFREAMFNRYHSRKRDNIENRALVIFIEQLSRLDSSGIAYLISLRRDFEALCIVGASDNIWAMLERLGMANIFILHKDRESFEDDVEFLKLVR